MTRAFEPRAVEADLVDRLVDLARRAPSAGNSQGLDVVVLEGDQTSRFWDVTLPVDRRATFRWRSLLAAPVIILPYADPTAYLDRYSEADKAASGLADEASWPVAYWQLDAAMAVMVMLLAAHDAGLGALWFGVFHEGEALGAALGVPQHHQLIGALALGHRLPSDPGRSAGRPRRPLAEVVHRGGW